MKYDIELISVGAQKLGAIKLLRITLGCNLDTAGYYADNTPCIIKENVDESEAEKFLSEFNKIGAEIRLIENNETLYVPETKVSTGLSKDGGYFSNDRDLLMKLWSDYNGKNKSAKEADNQIRQLQKDIKELKIAVNDMEKTINNNQKIIDTKGECRRPYARRLSLISFPDDFDIVKWIFVSVAVIFFIIMLVMVVIVPDAVEKLAETINVNAGAMIWLGAPVIGVAGVILYSLIYMIKEGIENHSINKNNARERRNFDTKKVYNEAVAFFEKVDGFKAEKQEKENNIHILEEQIINLENFKKSLPAVQNNIPMPQELKNEAGIALLIQYIDTGRADSLKEAINLYYQDVKDSIRLKELQKQTQYAQEQMENSRIAAENSRIAAENTRRTMEETRRAADAAERAADAASEAADYERRSYWDNLYKGNK